MVSNHESSKVLEQLSRKGQYDMFACSSRGMDLLTQEVPSSPMFHRQHRMKKASKCQLIEMKPSAPTSSCS